MSEKSLGIIGGGQLGSMLSVAAKKLEIKTTVYFIMILKIYLLLIPELLLQVFLLNLITKMKNFLKF